MSKFEFFYADIEANTVLLNHYNVGDWIHAQNGVVATRLRGGLLTNCDVRVAYLPHPEAHIGYRQMDEDYKNLQLIIFSKDLNYQVLDKFHIGNKAQILMSQANLIKQRFDLDEIVRAARADFRELNKAEPIAALDNPSWKRRVAVIPGVDGKNSPKKGFLTRYWK